jgi:hypothetical protein
VNVAACRSITCRWVLISGMTSTEPTAAAIHPNRLAIRPGSRRRFHALTPGWPNVAAGAAGDGDHC